MIIRVTLTTIFILMVIAILANTTANGQQVVIEGLVSTWTFDRASIEGDTAKDAFGNNDGTVQGISEKQNPFDCLRIRYIHNYRREEP